MSLHLTLLIAYSILLIGLGLWLGRRVTQASDFFVARHRLGAGLIFSTMLAANIGTGSTVGASGVGYQIGLSAWWWNGSAGIGSLLLALWVGPRIWREAHALGFLTVGDFLEHHFGAAVRALVTSVVWIASLFILAGQLIGGAAILNVVAGLSKPVGCLVAGAVVTTYFTAGGLHGSARVNVVQLVVKLSGFAIALPLVIAGAGGWAQIVAPAGTDSGYGTLWRFPTALTYLVLLVPPFISSPGLLQKAYGARDGRAVRIGIGCNGVALLVFGFVPAMLGMSARVHYPDLAPDLVLPTLLARDLPAGVGGLLLAAIFSAEVSAADAVLFMLSTSLSQDLYRRFINRGATDGKLLRVARLAAGAGGALGVIIAIALPTIIGALSIFYALIGAGLFVPVIVGLYAKRPATRAVALSIVAGMLTVIIMHLMTGGRGIGLWTPAVSGLVAAFVCYVAVSFLSRLPPPASRPRSA